MTRPPSLRWCTAAQTLHLLALMMVVPCSPLWGQALHFTPADFGAAVAIYPFAAAFALALTASGGLPTRADWVAPTALALAASGHLTCLSTTGLPTLLSGRLLTGLGMGWLLALLPGLTLAQLAARQKPPTLAWLGRTLVLRPAQAVALGLPALLALGYWGDWRWPFAVMTLLHACLIHSWCWGRPQSYAPNAEDTAPPPTQGSPVPAHFSPAPAHTARQLQQRQATSHRQIQLRRWNRLFWGRRQHARLLVLSGLLSGSVLAAGTYFSGHSVYDLSLPPTVLPWLFVGGGALAWWGWPLAEDWLARGSARRALILTALAVASALGLLTSPATAALGWWVWAPAAVSFIALNHLRALPLQLLVRRQVREHVLPPFLLWNTVAQLCGGGLGILIARACIHRTAEGQLTGYATTALATGLCLLAALLVAHLLEQGTSCQAIGGEPRPPKTASLTRE